MGFRRRHELYRFDTAGFLTTDDAGTSDEAPGANDDRRTDADRGAGDHDRRTDQTLGENDEGDTTHYSIHCYNGASNFGGDVCRNNGRSNNNSCNDNRTNGTGRNDA